MYTYKVPYTSTLDVLHVSLSLQVRCDKKNWLFKFPPLSKISRMRRYYIKVVKVYVYTYILCVCVRARPWSFSFSLYLVNEIVLEVYTLLRIIQFTFYTKVFMKLQGRAIGLKIFFFFLHLQNIVGMKF